MDNYSYNGSGSYDDMFGFIPPNLMFPEEHTSNSFSSKEEAARHNYHIDHDNEWRISDEQNSSFK